jgi:uncharacterized protein YfaQ (DUF2300 family)
MGQRDINNLARQNFWPDAKYCSERTQTAGKCKPTLRSCGEHSRQQALEQDSRYEHRHWQHN